MANQVHVVDPPRAIGRRTAEEKEGGHLEFGGWTWRDDPVPLGPSGTEVRLTYGGSAVPASIREDPRLPPFGAGHLADRPRHLAPRPPTGETGLAYAQALARPPPTTEESDMTTTYTFDVFCSLDGYGAAGADWTGYWGKQGPELLDRRLAEYGWAQRMVFGAQTYRAFARMLGAGSEQQEVLDPWVTRMRHLPATVVSTTLEAPLDWPDATVVAGDAVDVVARLKEESDVPLRSHGSLSMNRALMAAGLVDRLQVTIFPVITGRTGLDPVFRGAADFDLELTESRVLDHHIQELVYRPALH